MLDIGQLLDKGPATTPAKGPRSERAHILGLIIDRLESDRRAHPYYFKDKKKIKIRPYTAAAVAVRLSYLKTEADLYHLYSVCKDSKPPFNFSLTFNYLTKSKIES